MGSKIGGECECQNSVCSFTWNGKQEALWLLSLSPGVTPLAAVSDAELVNLLKGFSPNVAKEVQSKLPSITSAQVQVEDFSSRMLVGSRARQYRQGDKNQSSQQLGFQS